MQTGRRAVMAGGAALVAGAAAPATAWQFEWPSLDEGILKLADYRGKALLVVNTASFCAFTPQYKQLESLHAHLAPRGFAVIGCPSQDFGQESGTNAEVKAFCELTYGVEFPMAAIGHVRGDAAAPFYKWVRAEKQWEPRWNFFKVLIARDGSIAGTFGADDEPGRGPLSRALKAVLAPA